MSAGHGSDGLRFVADANIPYASAAFDHLGEVVSIPGNEIDREVVREADILLVRSWTKINRELLEGSKVRFVASAVTGTDHIDFDYLASGRIGFAGAAGSNANSVAEYVVAALLRLARDGNFQLKGRSIGIVGLGNVGGRLSRKAEVLGLTVLWNDPPLKRETGDERYLPLEQVLDADIVTLHVPLTKTGPDRTFRLADRDFFERLSPETIFINSSRGPVVDEAAYRESRRSGTPGKVIMDVWDGEPAIDRRMVAAADIATPHIAGHSFDAKVNGTVMIYRAVCEFLGTEPVWDPSPLLPPPDCPVLSLEAAVGDEEGAIDQAVSQVYDIMEDDAALRRVADDPQADVGKKFLELRKKYRIRREFHNTVVERSSETLKNKLAGIGFKTD